MLNQNFKKTVAMLLVVAMTIGNEGFSVFANSVDEVVDDILLNQKQEKNYASLYYEEHYSSSYELLSSEEESVNVFGYGKEAPLDESSKDSFGADDNENIEETPKNNDENEDDFDDDSFDEEETIKDEKQLLEELGPDVVNNDDNDEEEEEEEDYPEEPEEDEEEIIEDNEESEEVKNNEEEQETTLEKVNEDETKEETEDIEETSGEETSEEETTETTLVEEETETNVVETEETEETKETEGETIDEDIVDENETKTASESEVENEEDAIISTDSEIENIATDSEIDELLDEIVDLKSTMSQIEFVDATMSEATDSEALNEVVIIKYVIASESLVATNSVWRVKDFLYTKDTGAVSDAPSIETVKEKYLPTTIKILLEDNLGNEKVVRVNANWNVEIVNHSAGETFDKIEEQKTVEHIPMQLKYEGYKLNEDKTILVSEYDISVNSGINNEDSEEIEENRKKLSENEAEPEEDIKDEVVGFATSLVDFDVDDLKEEIIESTDSETNKTFVVENEPKKKSDYNVLSVEKTVVENYEETNGNDVTLNGKTTITTITISTVSEKASTVEKQYEQGLQGNANNNIAKVLGTSGSLTYYASPDINDIMSQLIEILDDDDTIVIPEDVNRDLMLASLAEHNTVNFSLLRSGLTDSGDYTILNEGSGTLGLTTVDSDKHIHLAGNYNITGNIDMGGHDLYICLGGSTLTFTGNYYISNIKNLRIVDCHNFGDEAAVGTITSDGTDRGNADSKSISCFEATNQTEEVIIANVNVKNITSLRHNKVQYIGYDDEAAALVYASASSVINVFIGYVNASNLTGAKGGLIKVEKVSEFILKSSKFINNKAFMGAIANIKFDCGDADYCYVSDNIFIGNKFAFYDYNDNNKYTYSKYVNDEGKIVDASGSEISVNSNGIITNKDVIADKDGYTSVTYPYEDPTMRNGLLLMSDFGKHENLSSRTRIQNNTFNYNMPYDMCPVIHFSFNNKNVNVDNQEIVISNNKIKGNKQFVDSSSGNQHMASGMVISVNPNSSDNGGTDERGFDLSSASKIERNVVVWYDKKTYNNSLTKKVGDVYFYNNEVKDNENNSSNVGAVSFMNMKNVYIQKDVDGNKYTTNKDVSGNKTNGDGAAYCFYRNENVEVYNQDFHDNESFNKGGAVSVFENEKIYFDETVSFHDNKARTFGGAINIEDSMEVTFNKVEFNNNVLPSGSRYIVTTGASDIYSKAFYFELWQNTMGGHGQPLLYPGYQNIIDTYFNATYCGATGSVIRNIGKGGAVAFTNNPYNTDTSKVGVLSDIYNGKKGKITFEQCKFTNNISSYTGGAVYVSSMAGEAYFTGTDDNKVEVKNNLSGRSGGGIVLENTKAYMTNMDVSGNRSEQGGAILTTTNPTYKTNYGWGEDDTELLIDYSEITENGFLTDSDVVLKETYSSKQVKASWEKNNFEYNNTVDHYLTATEPLRKSNYPVNNYIKLNEDKSFNSGGAVYTFNTKTVFDKGTHFTKNQDTIYSIAGSTILTHQTANHEIVDKKEEILFENNTGNYVFGHFSSFKATFSFFGGKIANNVLDVKNTSNKIYYYIATETESTGAHVYTARPLTDYKRFGERYILLAGNIYITDNTRMNQEGVYVTENLILEENDANKEYIFEIEPKYRLHKNAQICLTPVEPNKLSYQLFGKSTSPTDTVNNRGLWNTEWIEGIGEGAIPQNMFKNDAADNVNDERGLYVAKSRGTSVNNYGQIYLMDPYSLEHIEFDMLDTVYVNGVEQHRFKQKLETQYFVVPGGILDNPISTSLDPNYHMYSTDSTTRLVDVVGYAGSSENKRFASWDFDFEFDAAYFDEDEGENRDKMYAIYSRTDHRHKVCGTAVGTPCNHPDGSTHDDMIYGELPKHETSTVQMDNLMIEVSTYSQLLYARQSFEKGLDYMYVLMDDIVIDETSYGRRTDKVLNSTTAPIKDLKICLNGHNIIINSNRELATIFGDNCYICNCQPKEANIGYAYDASNSHNFASKDYMFKLLDDTDVQVVTTDITEDGDIDTNVTTYDYDDIKASKFNLYGNKDGHIVIDSLYLYTTAQSVINVDEDDLLNVDYVTFRNIGENLGKKGTALKSSLLNIYGDCNISNVNIENVEQLLKKNPRKVEHSYGQGLIRLTDSTSKAATVNINNLYVNKATISNQFSGVIVSNHINKDSKLNITNSTFNENHVGGRGAITLNPASGYYYGNTNIKNCTFSEVVPNSKFTLSLTGGALYSQNNAGELNIEDNYFYKNGRSGKAINGGAIYLGAYSGTDATNTIYIRNNKFIENNGNFGGAIAMVDSVKTEIDNCIFDKNNANYGSALYIQTSNTSYSQGTTLIKGRLGDVTFKDNGTYGTTQGTIALKSYASKQAHIIFENVTARGNAGKTSFLYSDCLNSLNKVIFRDTNDISENTGNTILFTNTTSRQSSPEVYFVGTTSIINNVVDSYTIQAAKSYTTFHFAGLVNIRDNRNTVGDESDIAYSNYTAFEIIATPNELYNNETKLKADNSYIKFYYTLADDGKDIVKWNKDTIDVFAKPRLMSQEHFVLDRQNVEDGYVIYKRDDDYLSIGARTSARKLVGNITDEDFTTQHMYIAYNAKAYVDNFGTPSIAEISNDLYKTYTLEGWIAENSEGKFVKWKFDEDLYWCRRTVDQAFDAYWSTYHPHRICGTREGEACNHVNGVSHAVQTNWIIAYNRRLLNIDKNGHYMLSNDITLEDSITNVGEGYSICLNGFNLIRDDDFSMFRVDGTSTEKSDIYISDCDTSIPGNGSIMSAPNQTSYMQTPIFDVIGSNSETTLELYGIRFTNLYYSGNNESVVVNSKNANVMLSTVSFATTEMSYADPLVKVDGGNLSMQGIEVSAGTFTDGVVLVENLDSSSNVIFDKFDIKNLTDDGNPFIKVMNVEGKFTYKNSTITQVTNVSSVNGGVLYVKDVNEVNLEDMTLTSNVNNAGNGGIMNLTNTKLVNISNSNISSNKSGNGGAIYVMDATASTINITDSIINQNTATSEGGAIYYVSEVSGGKLNISNTPITNNTATGEGGAIKLYSNLGTHAMTFDLVGNNVSNNTSSKNGGAFALYETKGTIKGLETDELIFTNNTASKDGGAIYMNKSSIEYQYAKFTSNKALDYGSAIYVVGLDTVTNGANLMTSGLDKIVLGNVDISNNTIERTSIQSLDDFGGALTIGYYANFELYGKVLIENNIDNSADGSKNLLIMGDLFELGEDDVSKYTTVNTGVSRIILNTDEKQFDYDNSRVHVTTGYGDETIVKNWITERGGTNYSSVFIKDTTDPTLAIYVSGTSANRTIHLGKNAKPVYFNLDGGKIRGSDGSDVTVPTTQYVARGVEAELDYFGYDTSGNIDIEVKPTKEGFEFEGFVTYVYIDSTTYALTNFDFETDTIMMPSENKYMTVYAVWSKNENRCACGLVTCNHSFEIAVTHETLNKWIYVNYFEQMYFYKENAGYILNQNIDTIARDLDGLNPQTLTRPIEYANKRNVDKGIITDEEDMYLYLNEKTLTIKSDITLINSNTANSSVIISNSSKDIDGLLYDLNDSDTGDAYKKLRPLVVAAGIEFYNVKISTFKMDDTAKFVEANDNALFMENVNVTNNTNINFYAKKSDIIQINQSNFESNTGNSSVEGLITCGINEGSDIAYIKDTVFKSNVDYYALINNKLSDSETEGTIKILNSTFDGNTLNDMSTSTANPAYLIKTKEPSTNTTGISNVILEGTEIKNNENYYGLIQLNSVNAKFERTIISNNKTYRYFVHQISEQKEVTMEYVDTTITSNEATFKGSYGIYRQKANSLMDKFTNFTMRDNTVTVGIYSANANGNQVNGKYTFGGDIIIKGNYYGSTNTGNVYVANVTNDDNNSFYFDDANPISSISEIGVYRPTFAEGQYLIFDTWTNDVHDHATQQLFTTDPQSSTWYVYKEEHSVRVSKRPANYITVNFDLNSDSDDSFVKEIKNQKIAAGSFVDEPIVPESSKGYTFLGWYIKKFGSELEYIKYDFTSESNDYKITATHSELIAVWDKNYTVTVDGNTGGVVDKLVLGDTNPKKSVFTVRALNTILGKATVVSRVDTDGTLNTSSTPYKFERDDLTDGGWYNVNAWNNGAGASSLETAWGEKWKQDTFNVVRDVNLYVRWRGAPYQVTFDGNKGDGSTDVTVPDYSDVATQYYLNVIEGNLPVPTRDGYDFLYWHSTTSFTTANRFISEKTVYTWSGDLTVYAEWKKHTYNVVYTAPDKDYGTMKNSVFTFDEKGTLRENTFAKNGYEFDYWVATLSDGVKRYTNMQVATFNMATKNNATVELEARWKLQEAKITLNLNDAIAYQTTKATVSTTSLTAIYSRPIGVNTSLPTPTRPGYTFDGWFMTKAAANAIDKDTSLQVTNDTIFEENATWKNYKIKNSVNTMIDSVLYARWLNNKYKVVFSNIDDNDEAKDSLEPSDITGELQAIDTCFDNGTNIINLSKSALAIDKKPYSATGFTYDYMLAYLGDEVIATINNASAKVSMAKGSPLYNFGLEDIASGSTIYVKANWTEHEYKVILYANNPKNSAGVLYPLITGATKSEFTVKYTDEYTIFEDKATTLTIDGFQFNGFSGKNITVSATESVTKLASSKVNNETLELYAQWINNYYTIKYVGGPDGTTGVVGSLNDQKIEIGEYNTYLYAPKGSSKTGQGFTYPGHTFLYWKDRETNATYSVTEKLTGDLRTDNGAIVTMEAVWRAYKFNIVFDYNIPQSPLGDEYKNIKTGTKSDMVNLPYNEEFNIGESVATIPGYKLSYWGNKRKNATIRATENETYTGENFGVTKDGQTITLYYIWEPKEMKVLLSPNCSTASTTIDWSGVDSSLYTVEGGNYYAKFYYDTKLGNNITQLTPKLKGYTFKGWTKEPQGKLTTTATKINKYDVLRPTDPSVEVADTYYAWWVANKIKVTFNANNDTVTDGHLNSFNGAATRTINVYYDHALNSIAAVPVGMRGGYVTDGWTVNSNGSGDVLTETSNLSFGEGEPVTVYAHYRPVRFNVVFATEANAGIVGVMATQSFTYEVTQNLTTNQFRREGFTFDHWVYSNKPTAYNQANASHVKQTYSDNEEASMIRETETDAILTAAFREHTYHIVYDKNTPNSLSGEENKVKGNMATQSVLYTTVTNLLPNNYELEGYTFVGWATVSNAPIDSDRNPQIDFIDGQEVTKLAGAAYEEAGENNIYTLYAQWKKNSIKINFNKNDKNTTGFGTTEATYLNIDETEISEIPDTEVIYDEPYINAIAGTNKYKAKRDGYTFLGWATASNINYDERENYVLTTTDYVRLVANNRGEATLYAVWKNDEITVRYKLDTRDFGSSAAPTTVLTKTAYFDMMLGVNSGVAASTPLLTADDTSISVDNFTFKNWYFELDSDNQTTLPTKEIAYNTSIIDITKYKKYINETYDNTKPLILYAYYDVQELKLNFVSTHSDVVIQGNTYKSVKPGVVIGNLPPDLQGTSVKRTGYTLTGWIKEDMTPVNANTPYWLSSADSNIYPVWTPNKYTVTFNKNHGAGTTDPIFARTENVLSDGTVKKEFTYNETVEPSKLPSISREGYKLIGWNTKTSGTGIVYSATESFVMNITNNTTILYAMWEAKTYTIEWLGFGESEENGIGTPSLVLNGNTYTGKVTTTQPFDAKLSVGGFPTVTREGYNNGEWYGVPGLWWTDNNWRASSDNNWKNKLTNASLFNSASIGQPITGDDTIKIYAKWIPKQYTVSFRGNKIGSGTAYVGNTGGGATFVTRRVLFGDQLNVSRRKDSIAPNIPSEDISGLSYMSNIGEMTHADGRNTSVNKTVYEGYTLKGYNTSADGSGDNIVADTKWSYTDSSKYVYAMWETNVYKLKYNLVGENEGYGSGNGSFTIASGSEIINIVSNDTEIDINYDSAFDGKLPTYTADSRPGYEFKGWFTKNGGLDGQIYASGDWGSEVTNTDYFRINNTKLPFTVSGQANNITLYAKWVPKSITISFDLNDVSSGKGSTTATKLSGDNSLTAYSGIPIKYNQNNQDQTTRIPVVSRVGYSFVGWSTNSNATTGYTNQSLSNRAITGDTTYYAIWQAKTYKVTLLENRINEFNVNQIETSYVPSSYSHNNDVVRVNYPSGNTFDVTFDSALTGLSSVTNPTVNTTGIYNQQGFVFNGYKTGSTTGDDVTSATVIDNTFYTNYQNIWNEAASTISLYPQWREKTYTVKIFDNTGSQVDSIELEYNDLKILDTSGYIKDGYTFLGLNDTLTEYTEAAARTMYNAVENQIKWTRLSDGAEITLYQIFVPTRYSITYENAPDEDGNVRKFDMAINSNLPTWYNILGETSNRLTKITTPSRMGYEFMGFESNPFDSTVTGTISEINITPALAAALSRDVVITSKWKAGEYVIRFHSNNGQGLVNTISLRKHQYYTIQNYGYSNGSMYLAYWNTEPNGSGKIYYTTQTIVDIVNANNGILDLYAIWKQRSISVGGGGSTRKGGGGGGGGGGSGGGGGGGGIAQGTNASTEFNPMSTGETANSEYTAGTWFYDPTTNSWKYVLANGELSWSSETISTNVVNNFASNGWYLVPSTNDTFNWYLFDSMGNMQIGWATYNNRRYYLDTNQINLGAMLKGWQTIDGALYYFDQTNGFLYVNTVTPDGYFVNEFGVAMGIADDQVKANSNTFVGDMKGELVGGTWSVDQNSGLVEFKIVDLNTNIEKSASNSWYTVYVNGELKSYHFNEMGIMQTGIFKDSDGNTYFLDDSISANRGSMKTGAVVIGNAEYYFNPKATNELPYGALMKNTTLPDGRRTDVNGKIMN